MNLELKQKDPFLELSEDSTLSAVSSDMYADGYDTDSDDTAALSSLSRISLVGDLSNEAIAARIVEASPSLAEVNFELHPSVIIGFLVTFRHSKEWLSMSWFIILFSSNKFTSNKFCLTVGGGSEGTVDRTVYARG